jgi:hypothetical protein
MSEPDPALRDLLAVAGYTLAPRGDEWIATQHGSGQETTGKTPTEAARKALARLQYERETAERAEQVAAALERLGIERSHE